LGFELDADLGARARVSDSGWHNKFLSESKSDNKPRLYDGWGEEKHIVKCVYDVFSPDG
jgi:hypothetical protein